MEDSVGPSVAPKNLSQGDINRIAAVLAFRYAEELRGLEGRQGMNGMNASSDPELKRELYMMRVDITTLWAEVNSLKARVADPEKD